MVRTSLSAAFIHSLLVEFAKELTNCWNGLGIELCYFTWVDRNTNTTYTYVSHQKQDKASQTRHTSCGVYAERSFQQVVPVLRHFCIETRVSVL